MDDELKAVFSTKSQSQLCCVHPRWLLVQDLEFNAVTEDTNIKAMPVSNDGEIKARTKAIKAAHYAMNQKIREAWNTKSAEEVVKALIAAINGKA